MLLTYENFFEDYFINKKIGREKYYRETYPNMINKNLDKKSILVKDILNRISLYKFDSNNYNIMILDSKFKKIINEQKTNFNFYLITTSLKKYKEILYENNCKIYLAHRWMALVDQGFITHDLSYVVQAIENVVNFIKMKKIRLVILGNDKLFIEKLIQYSANTAGIEIVMIQHGIYNTDSFKILNTSNTAEHLWTWSNYVKDTYQQFFPNGCQDIRVIGYPLEITQQNSVKSPCVLFLGNQYANYNKEEGEQYLEIAYNVYKACQEKHIGFIYRKHPAEKITNAYGKLKEHLSTKRNLMDDLQRISIAVGDVSSVMFEAALVGKHVIQIIWSERSQIGNDPMYSFTVKADKTYNSIINAIDYCINKDIPNKIDDYYLWVNNNFANDVNNLIEELIKY